MRIFRLLPLVLSITGSVGAQDVTPIETQPGSVIVFAAASMAGVLQDAGNVYTKKTGQPIKLSFGESFALARRIEAGERADVFIPADSDEALEYLEALHLIDADSIRNVIENRLVLIAAKNNPIILDIRPAFALTRALGKGRLAIGNPGSTPVGRFARYALISLGAWNSVADHFMSVDNSRAVVAAVESGAAPLGIVYESDAFNQKGVRVVGVIPENMHPQINFLFGLTKANAAATRFINFLRGPEGQAIFVRHGFKHRRHKRPRTSPTR